MDDNKASLPLWQRRGAFKKGAPLNLKLDLVKPAQRTREEQELDAKMADVARGYQIQSMLGQGSTSTVKRAVRLSDGHHVALKVMRSEDPEMHAVARKEFEMLSSINHKNIVQAQDFVTLPHSALLVLDFFDGMDLSRTIAESAQGHLPETLARPLVTQLADAVDHLHGRGILHRDIKPQNVLVSKDLETLTLIDFNVACSLNDGPALTPTGTRLYTAPEVVLGETHTEFSDVWSIGLCAHLLLSGRLPQGRSRCEEFSEPLQVCAMREVSFKGSAWGAVSAMCKDALRRCLDLRPAERSMASGLLASEWLRKGSSANAESLTNLSSWSPWSSLEEAAFTLGAEEREEGKPRPMSRCSSTSTMLAEADEADLWESEASTSSAYSTFSNCS